MVNDVNDLVKGTILVNGFVRGSWKITRKRSAATRSVEPFTPLSKTDSAVLARAGNRLLAFAEAEAKRHDVRIAANTG